MTKDRPAIRLLKNCGFRVTEQRVVLLEFLMQTPQAHTLADLEKSLSLDRVTIYRSLTGLVEKDALLKLINQRGITMYMYHPGHDSSGNIHPHVRCKQCGSVTCLPDLPNDYRRVLKRFNAKDMTLLLEGTCTDCCP